MQAGCAHGGLDSVLLEGGVERARNWRMVLNMKFCCTVVYWVANYFDRKFEDMPGLNARQIYRTLKLKFRGTWAV